MAYDTPIAFTPNFNIGLFGEDSNPGSAQLNTNWQIIDEALIDLGIGPEDDLEVNNLIVNGSLRAFEFIVQRVKATGGDLLISAASGKLAAIAINPTTYIMEDLPEDSGTSFDVGDIILIQRAALDGGTVIKQIFRTVSAVEGNKLTLTPCAAPPGQSGQTDVGNISVGDAFVQIGSETDPNRRGSIYITVSNGKPKIVIKDNVAYSADWNDSATIQTVIGDLDNYDFEGEPLSGYGIVSQQLFIGNKDQIKASDITDDGVWGTFGDVQGTQQLLDDMANDSKLTGLEQILTINQWRRIEDEKPGIDAEADRYGVDRANYDTAYTELYNYLNYSLDIFSYDPATVTTINIVKETWDLKWDQYWFQRAALYNSILQETKGTTDTLQSDLTDARNVADSAQTDATDSLAQLNNISSDGVVTPAEKRIAHDKWRAIIAEKSGIDAEADRWSVSKTAYGNAYSALNTYLNTTIAVFADMDSNTNVIIATWNTKWDDYYDERQNLLNAITEKIRSDLTDVAGNLGIKTYIQDDDPSGTNTIVTGDLWIETDNDNWMWRWNGSTWVDATRDIANGTTTIINGTVTTDFVNALDVTANSVVAGWVYAGNISAGQVTAGTFSGFTIKTSTGDNRIEITNSDDIDFYSNNSKKFSIYPSYVYSGGSRYSLNFRDQGQSLTFMEYQNVNNTDSYLYFNVKISAFDGKVQFDNSDGIEFLGEFRNITSFASSVTTSTTSLVTSAGIKTYVDNAVAGASGGDIDMGDNTLIFNDNDIQMLSVDVGGDEHYLGWRDSDHVFKFGFRSTIYATIDPGSGNFWTHGKVDCDELVIGSSGTMTDIVTTIENSDTKLATAGAVYDGLAGKQPMAEKTHTTSSGTTIDVTGYDTIRCIYTGTSSNITGLTGGVTGQTVVLYNSDSYALTVVDATALNMSGNFTLGDNETITFKKTSQGWLEIGRSTN